ncbi:MAG: hypothetical protein QGF28_06125 [Candidatus Thalassarchaeaceae archaeon]|nr:hypothetical protein [Candidatus Thalassarchaeaceae archaeon]MDP7256745.1 hypothetical protein [Candidatus Thalassarchaeaceae archaeon]MDP7446755.1 hypothetical protein [Candidatus Thalassarchaeaceae archaeon]MDP7649418.1 hypothetical protein [Candidatus Thalassarchaeaceae archaeon]HJO84315.1 hypothetical protein [Candidatus Thalassarchaeaceae archaeon]
MAKVQMTMTRSGTRIVEISRTVDNHERSLGSNPEYENLRKRSDVRGNAVVKARTNTNDHLISIQSKGE